MTKHAPLIVFADDDPDTFQLYRMIVQRSSYQGLFVSDGADVLDLCQTLNISLLITDINKPKISGIELYCALRGDPATQHIPVVFVTAGGLEERQLPSDVNGILRKPFTH